jgi:diacylglycerol O-acyltransferase
MRRLSLLDANFLMAESRETPMHVGGVSLYRYPAGVNKRRFLNELKEILLDGHDLRPPFNQRLASSLLSRANVSFAWEADEDIDLDYHVRHSALPRPGRYRELFTLISRLHSTLLDRNRPLWEMHLIEGLSGNQFATYLKIHHCMMDGVGAMHATQSMLSKSARGRRDCSPLSREAWDQYRSGLTKPRSDADISRADIRSFSGRIAAQLGSGVNLTRAMLKYANVWIGGGKPLNVPWHAVPHAK